MTSEICNALFRYFEALYDLNRDLIMLCGADVLDNSGQYDKCVRRVVKRYLNLYHMEEIKRQMSM